MKELDYYFSDISNYEIFENTKYVWEPINKLDDYLKDKIVLNDIKINKGNMSNNVNTEGNYYIGENTNIESNVSIIGPVIIGNNVVIRSGALIRPGTIINDNVIIGHCAEIKHSIVLENAKVQSFTFCGDSIIGNNARVGSGTILANRRFDQKNIKIDGNDTKMDFFGAIVGDNSRLGAHVTTMPGSLIGPYSWIFPNVQTNGFIEREKRVISKQENNILDNKKIELK